jgi:hypothetical protein
MRARPKPAPAYGESENAPQIANGEDLQAEDLELTPVSGVPWFIKTKGEWGAWWWKRPAKLCQRCRRDCKQSWRVVVNRCPQFEPRSERRANV